MDASKGLTPVLPGEVESPSRGASTGGNLRAPDRGDRAFTSMLRASERQPTGSATAVSAFAEDEDLSKEQLSLIKARTMYEMVQEIDDGSCKLLFLTNPQAELIASSAVNVQKMLDVGFEFQKPSLVINLLMSGGMRDHLNLFLTIPEDMVGCYTDIPPFITDDDEDSVEAKIDMFVMDVVIPLAAQTNAVVLCNAVAKECVLSASFTRMCTVAGSRWGGKLPFSILSVTNKIDALYRNLDEDSFWRKLRRQTRAWRHSDQQLLEVSQVGHGDLKLEGSRYDIDPHAECILITDNINPKTGKMDAEPFNRLMAAILQNYHCTVPSIAIKTGLSLKSPLGAPSEGSLRIPAELAESGVPVLFLDVRARRPIPATAISRFEIVEAGKAQLSDLCDEFLQYGRIETLDVCSTAYLHDLLNGDGQPFAVDLGEPRRPDSKTNTVAHALLPLHEAISRTKEGELSGVEDGCTVPRASAVEIANAAEWLCHRIFRDAWHIQPDREEREARGETYRKAYKDLIVAQTTYVRTLLLSPNLYHANLQDMDGARRLVNRLVRLDRLPTCNPHEGLLLLRSAWCKYDVAMMMAGRYKRISKVVFFLQLLLGWIVVNGSVLSWQYTDYKDNLVHVVFGVSVAGSFLVSLEGWLTPKMRWRQLRAAAGSLQSLIWLYRTRVGPFEVDETRRDSTQPEAMLCASLAEWSDNLIAGAGLTVTNLKRRHPGSVWKHCQYRGKPPDGTDDFHSPTQPSRYIELRIKPAVRFYEERIPRNTRRSTFLKLSVLLLGLLSSVLARYEQLMWVAISTALAGAITAWAEFGDAESKVQRYSKSITALENLLNWWDSLGDVQKASKEMIVNLVGRAEAILADEQSAWTSAASKRAVQNKSHKADDEASEDGKVS